MSGEGRGAGGGPGPDPGLLAEAVDRVAHQIKNPLQAVSMNLEVIRMRVSQEAPELWEELERFAGAVDDNVGVLDRRLRLLLALGRRSAEDTPESVDVTELVEDFAAALRLDEERPALRVESTGAGLAARARPGFLLELVLDVHGRMAREHPDREVLPVRVRAGREGVDLSFRLPGAVADGAADPEPRWRDLAERAGGRAALEAGDPGTRLRVRLPAD